MRRRTEIQLDLLSGGTGALILLGVLFLIGGALGCVAAAQVDGASGAALEDYLEAYLTVASGGGAEVSLRRVVWEQLRFPLYVVLLGFTALGVVAIPVLVAVKGFLFAFSVACFCRLFGWAGLMPAAFLFGLPALLWAPALFVLSAQALDASHAMFCRCMGEERRLTFCQGGYWVRCALCAAAAVLCAALEYLALPALVGASAVFVL